MSKHTRHNHKEDKPIYIGVVNDSVITTESVKLALRRMKDIDIGIRVEQIEEIPFLRNLMMYLSKYKLDIVILDGEMEKQNVPLYIERIKNFDPEIKIIVLAKFITPKIVELNKNGYIDEYITLPFQDANLWSAIEKVVFPKLVKEEYEIPRIEEENSKDIEKSGTHDDMENDEIFLFEDDENELEDESFDLSIEEKTKERINVFEYARRSKQK